MSTVGALPAVVAQPDARAALLKVAGWSRRQGAASVALLAPCLALALWGHAASWLALFAALLLPLCVTANALLALQAIQSRMGWRHGWRPLWSVLLAVLPLSAVVAAGLYRYWRVTYGVPGLDEVQMFVSALGCCVLALALPLWIAQSQARALHLSTLTQAALAADLKALQAQIEPHFLYNTLANTRYLARHDPPRAVEMLDHLIAYLHSALPDLRSPMSCLGREFELAQHYLALMGIRFGARLRIELECPEALSVAELPPLLLMPLVENAVQHGVEPQRGTVTVRLLARRDGQHVLVQVRDNGAGVGGAVLGSGVGLRNVRQRLAALYGSAASCTLHAGDGGWTLAELRLPVSLPHAMPGAVAGHAGPRIDQPTALHR
jgi:hypothetical protein